MMIDLSDPSLRSACQQAMMEVLETMFFEIPLDEPVQCLAAQAGDGALAATASFGGSLTGSLTVMLDGDAARSLAASFLGMDPGMEEDGPGPAELRSVVIELANVLCGATMSRMEPAGRLRIEQPVIVERTPALTGPWLSVPLECGSLDVHVRCGVEP